MVNLFQYRILPNSVATGVKYPVKQIKVRGLTVKELRAIASANVETWTISNILEYYGKTGIIILEKEDGSQEDLGILAKEDFFILLYFVNILTNPDFSLTYSANCPNCGTKNTFNVNIDTIKFKEKKLPDTIPFVTSFNLKAKIRRVTVKDMVISDEIINSFKDLGYEEADILKALVTSFEITDEFKEYIEEELKKEVYKEIIIDEREKNVLINLLIFDLFLISDLQKYTEIIDMLKIEIEPFKIICSKCKTKFETEIEIDLKDILPEDTLNIYIKFRYNA